MRSTSFADTLLEEKGLGCYLGYDEENNIGKDAGPLFFERMLTSRQTIDYVFEHFPPHFRKNHWYKDIGDGKTKEITAHLKCYPENCNISYYPQEEMPTPDNAVDLGLSVKWASCNLGAKQPYELGQSYELTDQDLYNILKEHPDWFSENGDSVDLRCTEYDYAYAQLGGSWRMPSIEELKELREKCDWKVVTINDVAGVKITSKDSTKTESIFLPAKTVKDEAAGLVTYTLEPTTYSSGMRSPDYSSNLFNFAISGYIAYIVEPGLSITWGLPGPTYVRPVWEPK